MRKLLRGPRKSPLPILISALLVFGLVFGYQTVSKPLIAQAHYALDHPYPGYLIQYNPTKYDDHVKVIQHYLNAHNPDEFYYNVGVEDGYFGAKTLSMVQKFQDNHGLTIDGIVGPETWDAIVFEYN